jgi:hypothetical protein
MTAIVTTPHASWTSAHRAMLFVLATVLTVAVAVTVIVLLMTGRPEVLSPGAPTGGEGSCGQVLIGAC